MKNLESIAGIILLLLSESLEKLPYILEGEQTTIARFPYQVAIVVKHYPYGIWLKGGGTIVTKRHVISSCTVLAYISKKMFENEFVFVHGNSVDWRNGTPHLVKDVYEHPEFSELTLNSDIAVVRVETPFDGEYEKPIKLAANNYKINSKAVISGWGTKTHYPVKLEEYLQKLEVNIIERKACKRIYNKPGATVRVTEKMMCSLNPGKGSCQGDSGGPLVQGGVLIGIISWNRKCGDMHYPSVYTNISALWIYLRMAEKRFKIKFTKTYRC